MSRTIGIKWIDLAPNDYTPADIQAMIGVYTDALRGMVNGEFRQFTYVDIQIMDGYALMVMYMSFEQVSVRVYDVRVTGDELKILLNKSQEYVQLLYRLGTDRVSEIIASMDQEIKDMMRPDGVEP